MSKLTFSLFPSLLLAVTPVLEISAEEGSWQELRDRRTLREAGIEAEPEQLLAFLRKHTLTDQRRQSLTRATKDLGHRSYRVRHQASLMLLRAGPAALPTLKVALRSGDQEVQWRARTALREVNRIPYRQRIMAAMRLLGTQQPEGTTEALMAYLPSIADEEQRSVALAVLARVGMEDGKPRAVVLAAVRSADPSLRAAVAQLLVHARPLPVEPLQVLLKDPVPEVRFHAAQSMLRGGEKMAMPELIALLGELPDEMRMKAEDLLYLVGDHLSPPSPTLASAKEKIAAWQSWWEGNRESLRLDEVNLNRPTPGAMVVCEYDGGLEENGCIRVLGRDGKERWEIDNLRGPNDAHLLPNGRVLVAERNGSRVTERDRKGRIVWEIGVSGGAIACQRLESGNTLITGWNEVMEVTRDHKLVWRYHRSEGLRHAKGLPGGTTLAVTAKGEVLHLSEEGKLLKSIKPEGYGRGAGYWASVERTPEGHYLLAMGSEAKVIEIDETGRVLREHPVRNAVFATQTKAGHLLACNFEERVILTIDSKGEVISRKPLAGRPFSVRRY